MNVESALRDAVKQHNADIGVQAAACAILGLIGTALVTAAVGFAAMRWASSKPVTLSRWLLITGVVCAMLFTIGLVSGLLRGGSRGATDRADRWFEGVAEMPLPLWWGGEASLLGLVIWALHGPYAFVEALSLLRQRMPVDESSIRAGAALLVRLAEGESMPVASADRAVMTMLLRLKLIRPNVPRRGGTETGAATDFVRTVAKSVVITEKGRALRWLE
ncbi:MAG: hypothetical protein ACKVZJ_08130 [Phycisphaerales bacterium]